MAPVHAERQSNPDAVSDSFDLLDQYYLRELQLVRRTQADRNRRTGCLCAIGCRRDLPRPGTRSAVYRNDADFQHTVTQRSCAAVIRLRPCVECRRLLARTGWVECPLWVQSGHSCLHRTCPLSMRLKVASGPLFLAFQRPRFKPESCEIQTARSKCGTYFGWLLS